MLALTRAVNGEAIEALEGCSASSAEAARFGDPRSETLTRLIEAMISLYRADYDRVLATCDRGLALARQLGARRFEAELMALQGHAIGELGGSADAQVLLQRASTLALEVARPYCAPWCLGVQALHTPNVERARELLVQGEALLAGGCVSHNHLEYRRVAMEFGLRHGDARETRRHAAALRDYTRRSAHLERPHHRAGGVPRGPDRGRVAGGAWPPGGRSSWPPSTPTGYAWLLRSL